MESRVGGGAQSVGADGIPGRRRAAEIAADGEEMSGRLPPDAGTGVGCVRKEGCVRKVAASERWLRLKRGRGRMGMSGRLSAGAGTAIRKAASEMCLRGRLSAGWSGCDGWPAEGLRRSLAIGWRIVVGEAAGDGSMTGGLVRSMFMEPAREKTAVWLGTIGRLRPHGPKWPETTRNDPKRPERDSGCGVPERDLRAPGLRGGGCRGAVRREATGPAATRGSRRRSPGRAPLPTGRSCGGGR